MKPIILKVDADDRLVISADEIQDMVYSAYQEGYEDGYAIGKKSVPTITYDPSTTNDWWKNVRYNEVTCSNLGDRG